MTRLTSRPRAWLRLAIGIGALATGIALLELISPHMPGSAGAMFRHNLTLDTDVGALVYTETGDVREFLDAERGRYHTGSGR